MARRKPAGKAAKKPAGKTGNRARRAKS
jgi:hypothetical protein